MASSKTFFLSWFKSAFNFLVNHSTSQKELNSFLKQLKFPLVVKPRQVGSSIGVSIVVQKTYLASALRKAFRYDEEILLQKYLKGKEVTCGVLDFGTLQSAFPLVPTEIKPQKIPSLIIGLNIPRVLLWKLLLLSSQNF